MDTVDVALLLGFVGWVAAALALGWIMGRRGFDPFTWTVFGVALGPIAIVLAVVSAVRPPVRDPDLVRFGRHASSDALDVLVAWDGSPESAAALRAVERLLADRIGRLTLAHVVAFDATADEVRLATAGLEEAVSAVADATPPSTVLLYGKPADALRRYAHELGYDVLALGARGAGRSHALLGSVASALARGAGVPVLLADADRAESVAA